MLAILNEGTYDAWLSARPEKAKEFMRAYPTNWLSANPVEKKGCSELGQVPAFSKRKEPIEIDPLFFVTGNHCEPGHENLLDGFRWSPFRPKKPYLGCKSYSGIFSIGVFCNSASDGFARSIQFVSRSTSALLGRRDGP